MAPICAGCNQNIPDTKYLTCSLCKSAYDLDCANINNERFKVMMETEGAESWKCPACHCKIPKRGNTNTPVRLREYDSSLITPSPETNNVTVRRNTKTKTTTTKSINDTTTSLDTQTELTLQNLSETIMLRLQENNKSIITELKNTIHIEINKAILKLREDVERETNALLRQNEQRIIDIQETNTAIENLKIENEKLKIEIQNLKTITSTVNNQSNGNNCTESHSKKIVLYGLDEYYKESANNLHMRLIDLFRDVMNVDLMGYIEDTHRIGRYSTKNRPLVIELLSKRMTMYVKENRHFFQGTGLFLAEFLDHNARRERQLMREEMLRARSKGLHAIIRNNQLIIEGTLKAIENVTPKNRFSINKDREDQENSQNSQNNYFQSYNNTEHNNRQFLRQRPTI